MTDQVQLYHGDCLEILTDITPGSVQFIFSDLPYHCARHLSWDSLPFDLSAFKRAVAPLLRQSCSMACTANMRFAARLVESCLPFRYDLVWRKRCPSNFFLAKKQPLSYHENILIFAYGNHVYNPQMIDEKERAQILSAPRTFKARNKNFFGHQKSHQNRVAGPIYPRSILLDIKRDANRKSFHPTQKPVALLEWLIKTYTNPGDTVLDPVSGSATTAIAALRTGRRAICIEKDASYFAIGKARVEAEQARLEGAA